MERYTLPMLLIIVACLLLTGCFYLPVPEHQEYKTQADFRRLVGDARSTKPIYAGGINLRQTIALLGQPHRSNEVGNVVEYYLTTVRGLRVLPLCFEAYPHERRYALRLFFNESGVLTAWETADDGDEEAYMKFYKTGPTMIDRGRGLNE